MARFRLLAHAAGVVTVTAVLLAAVLTSPASACVCFPGNEALRYQQATQVFSGKVVSEKVDVQDGHSDRYRYGVVVDTEYKGDVPHFVNVVTLKNYSCSLRMTVGSEYVIFTRLVSWDGLLEIDQCSGTRSAVSGPPVTTSPSSPGMTTTPPATTPCATATP
ncbi:hypothetical protein [Saccharothrix sp. NRRL B-16314]|uniref:hypothetical protein n=1 Tax=Saccharothrix sp. NRRL B-16314 TaxID=1463825 RepID=UPI000525BEF1|nr:hypothetical protein [Saccharothrix sp. NRRL B-16314]